MDFKYTTNEEKRIKSKKSIEKLTNKKIELTPVIIKGTKIASTWWGKAWNENLESYSDYSNRISRGRSYIRNGSIIDLKISNGKVNALVQGSRAKPYKVEITISAITASKWKEIIKECAGKVESLQELIDGKFPEELALLFTQKGKGLFPSPKEISFDCSCPDYAHMCKHIAATLYGVGSRLDSNPALFFVLRDVAIDDLITNSLNEKKQSLLEKSETKSKRILEDEDVLAIFGVDMKEE